MPWKETCAMEEKLKFIVKLRDGASMTELCEEFQISRKTGYKLAKRYEIEGLRGMEDRSRRPIRLANMTDPKVQRLIVSAREKRPTWGAVKLLARLKRDHPDIRFPSRITAQAILERHGLVRKRRAKPDIYRSDSELIAGQAPNDLWCADHKGQYRLGNRQLCYPLTISDHFSRFLIGFDALESTRGDLARPAFQIAFEEYGLPKRIRTDNGPPFASAFSVYGLTPLSIWWLRLGIVPERIRPGHPEENGRHERIHLNIKRELQPKPSQNMLEQQESYELWRHDYNDVRPHESLGNALPSEVYKPSSRVFPKILPEPAYQTCDRILYLTNCGAMWAGWKQQKIFISRSLGGQLIGLKEQEDDLWEVRFTSLILGYVDFHEGVFHRGDV